jgi:SAM-dependent methyltransferase
VSTEYSHLDRARAESFGATAEQYDRGRLPYPDALFDDFAELRPKEVLDVACGTGRVARRLAQRGLAVLGVEVDGRMARIARGHGVEVELAAFESWDARGRRFDLITCGEAWHWIEPVQGIAKAADLLRPGGLCARFWGFTVVDEPLVSALEAVYARHAPDVRSHARVPDPDDVADRFGQSDAFEILDDKLYWEDHALTAEQWVASVSTYSDHQRLGPELLGIVSAELREAIEAHGGSVQTRFGTYVMRARRL